MTDESSKFAAFHDCFEDVSTGIFVEVFFKISQFSLPCARARSIGTEDAQSGQDLLLVLVWPVMWAVLLTSWTTLAIFESLRYA